MRYILMLALALIAGCGGEPVAPLGKRTVLKGNVTVKGAPVSSGNVVFTPVVEGTGEEQARDLSKKGSYILSVFPGKYKVWIKDSKSVPSKYASAKTTDKEVEVSTQDNENFHISF